MAAAGVREPWYMEEFNAQRIHEAIAKGANPKGYYGWMNHGNHIEKVKPL
jgi:hypothetical protein